MVVRTLEEIERAFAEMGLATEEQRRRFDVWRTAETANLPEVKDFWIWLDGATRPMKEPESAELA